LLHLEWQSQSLGLHELAFAMESIRSVCLDADDNNHNTSTLEDAIARDILCPCCISLPQQPTDETGEAKDQDQLDDRTDIVGTGNSPTLTKLAQKQLRSKKRAQKQEIQAQTKSTVPPLDVDAEAASDAMPNNAESLSPTSQRALHRQAVLVDRLAGVSDPVHTAAKQKRIVSKPKRNTVVERKVQCDALPWLQKVMTEVICPMLIDRMHFAKQERQRRRAIVLKQKQGSA
jgi:hypothetical protein